MAKCSSSYFVPSNCWLLKKLSQHAFTNEHSFLAHEELQGWLGNQVVKCKQWKVCNHFLIVSSLAGTIMHVLNGRQDCSYLDEIVKQKNVLHCICNHSLSLIICYTTSLTQYLTYCRSLPQATFDLTGHPMDLVFLPTVTIMF